MRNPFVLLLAASLMLVPLSVGTASAASDEFPFLYSASGGGQGQSCSKLPTEARPDCTRQQVNARIDVSPQVDCKPENWDPETEPIPRDPRFTCVVTFGLTMTVQGTFGGCGYASSEPTRYLIGCTFLGMPYASYPPQTGTMTYTNVPVGVTPQDDVPADVCADHYLAYSTCQDFVVKVQTNITWNQASQIDLWTFVDYIVATVEEIVDELPDDIPDLA